MAANGGAMTQRASGLVAAAQWVRAAAAGLTFRLATEEDVAFLFAVYASTRAEEMAIVPWSEAEKAAFIAQQAHAQHTDYRRNFSQADWLVVMRAGEAIGRLYLLRGERRHYIVDITFLPPHRGKGYGEALLRDLLDEATAAGKPVEIHVENYNRAMTLYRRLGFVTVEEQGVYELLRSPQPV